MCRSYRLAPPEKVTEHLGISAKYRPIQIKPAGLSPIVGEEFGVMHIIPAEWGFGAMPQFKILHARSETVSMKPTFHESFEKHRCVIPAQAFMEADSKQMAFDFYSDDIIYIAGIWRTPIYKNKEFVILTRNADRTVSTVHDRMPLLIPKQLVKPWVLGDKSDALEIMDELMVKNWDLNRKVFEVSNPLSMGSPQA
jgi:putative SOS response-associated peptidase YedK